MMKVSTTEIALAGAMRGQSASALGKQPRKPARRIRLVAGNFLHGGVRLYRESPVMSQSGRLRCLSGVRFKSRRKLAQGSPTWWPAFRVARADGRGCVACQIGAPPIVETVA
jgi:hypothetical protein